jgi:hypothetical protein
MNTTKLVEIFCKVDDFCKEFSPIYKKHLIKDDGKKHRNRKEIMSDAEIMTILILFHLSHARDLKNFYLHHVGKHLRDAFPRQLSYNRFTERQQRVTHALVFFLELRAMGKCTGISIIDSTPLHVCHPKRIRRNRVFRHWAKTGKGTMGWFHGFKLHLVVNGKGEIIAWRLTPANTDDRCPLRQGAFVRKLFGKLYADRGYVSKSLFEELFVDGIHLVTRIKKNMKNSLMSLHDKLILRKRSLIETINDELKNVCQIEHTRHRSIGGFVTNLIAGLIAYNFLPKKPELNMEVVDRRRTKCYIA